MLDPNNLDYESTLGVDNGGEPSAVTPATPVEKPAEQPTTPETPAAPVVQDEDVELDSEGKVVLDEHGQPKKKMGGFQRRIEKLSRKLEEKDKELEFLRRYALPQAPGGPASQPAAPQQPSQPGAEPVRDQFESNEEYLAAVVKYQVAETLKVVRAEEDKNKQQRTEQEIIDQFSQRLTQAPAKYKDWDDVMDETVSPSTGVMDNAIRRSEFGVDMMYFLAKNEAEARRIAQLSDPMAQVMAMGALEDRFRQASKPTTPTTPAAKVSAAPPPITPVNGSAPTESKPVSEMDGDEYLAFMRANRKK